MVPRECISVERHRNISKPTTDKNLDESLVERLDQRYSELSNHLFAVGERVLFRRESFRGVRKTHVEDRAVEPCFVGRKLWQRPSDAPSLGKYADLVWSPNVYGGALGLLKDGYGEILKGIE